MAFLVCACFSASSAGLLHVVKTYLFTYSYGDLSKAKFNLGNEIRFQSDIVSHEYDFRANLRVRMRALLSAANHLPSKGGPKIS